LVRYFQALKGEASTVKKYLPFVCPNVEYIERMIGSPEAIVILAKNKDAIVGAIGGWLKGTPSGYDVEDKALRQHVAYDEAHLCWIAVKEEYREKRIGSTLAERVCSWARMKGKKKIWTEAQRKTTDFDSVTFYKKVGFKEIGSFRDEKGEEYVTMLKQL
jgi:ribosomal protein S18 acetylase RimI-like enzyme